MKPIVSIIIPTYNRADRLWQTIDAMLKQTFTDWEMIICDDASTDNTRDVVGKYSDHRIRYYRNNVNVGLYQNWNKGIDLARGEFISIYHDHDIYLPTIVQYSVDALKKHPKAYFVHTAHLLINEENKPVDIDLRPFPPLMPGRDMQKLVAQCWHSPVLAPTVMVRKTGYKKVGQYDDSVYGLGADVNMWFRLSQIGDVAYISEPQAFWRVRTKEQYTGKFQWRTVSGSIQMRFDHLIACFQDNPLEKNYNHLRFSLERDKRLFVYMARSLVLESDSVIDNGQSVTDHYGSIWLRLVIRIMRSIPGLRGLMRQKFLPRYYQSLREMQDRRYKRALQYLDNTKNDLLIETLSSMSRTEGGR